MLDIGEHVEQLIRPACPSWYDDILMRSVTWGVIIAHDGPDEDIIENKVSIKGMILSSRPNLPKDN